jgi:hypothetical protein
VAAGLFCWAFVLSLHDSARPASESSSDATGNVGETRRNLQPRANDEVRARKSPGSPNSTNWKRTIAVWATEHNDTGLFAGAVKGAVVGALTRWRP